MSVPCTHQSILCMELTYIDLSIHIFWFLKCVQHAKYKDIVMHEISRYKPCTKTCTWYTTIISRIYPFRVDPLVMIRVCYTWNLKEANQIAAWGNQHVMNTFRLPCIMLNKVWQVYRHLWQQFECSTVDISYARGISKGHHMMQYHSTVPNHLSIVTIPGFTTWYAAE